MTLLEFNDQNDGSGILSNNNNLKNKQTDGTLGNPTATFPEFSPFLPPERERGRFGERPGNEVAGNHLWDLPSSDNFNHKSLRYRLKVLAHYDVVVVRFTNNKTKAKILQIKETNHL